ncbi:MAG: hypothetical protein ACREQI_15910 [Candidatus Binataceae bacterium]
MTKLPHNTHIMSRQEIGALAVAWIVVVMVLVPVVYYVFHMAH